MYHVTLIRKIDWDQLVLSIVRNTLNFKILDRAVDKVVEVKGRLRFLRKKN